MTITEIQARQGVSLRAKVAHERMKAAQIERDDAIRQAVADGLSLRQIAQTVGISHQRVAQIVKD